MRVDNPSAWRHRAPVVALAALGLAISCYLAAYQLGLVAVVWDPIFRHGSELVLHSPLSRALPLPDASLGALGYLIDTVLTSVGDEERYRTLPSIVLLLGVAAAGMALVSAGLIVYQAAIVRAFCTLCLASAAVSFAILALAWEEVRRALRVVSAQRA